jgi:hypothetical protein
MNYLNRAILEKYKSHWYTLRDVGYMVNLKESVVLELQSVYQQEIDSNFFVNKWCMSCVAEMIRILYLVTKFDEGLDINNPAEDLTEIVETVEAKEEIQVPAITVEPKKRGRKPKNKK